MTSETITTIRDAIEAAAKVLKEDVSVQARRFGIMPQTGESPGGWRDRVRLAAIRQIAIELAPVASHEGDTSVVVSNESADGDTQAPIGVAAEERRQLENYQAAAKDLMARAESAFALGMETAAKIADEHAKTWGLAHATPAIVISTAIRAAAPQPPAPVEVEVARAKFHLAAAQIERDVRLSDLTGAEIDNMIAALNPGGAAR